MTITSVLQAIQFILAPVVMVSACAILSGGLLSRYAAVNDRLRAMARERLELLKLARDASGMDPRGAFNLTTERFKEIDGQIPTLLSHHAMVRRALFALYGACAIFLADMLVIATSVVLVIDAFAVAAMGVFLVGVGMLLLCLLITVREIGTSHHALYYEVMHVAELPVTGPGGSPS